VKPVDFDAAKPIYRQIIEDYQKQIIRGELHSGDKIPSQREYAEKVRVNPNTVQRAYREMEMMGMVETQRGQGTFITVYPDMLQAMKTTMADSVVKSFIIEMQQLGFSGPEIKEVFTQELTNVMKGDKL